MRGPSQPEFGAAKSRWGEPGTGTGPHPASGEAERETRTELIRSGEENQPTYFDFELAEAGYWQH